jgi:tRNA 2-thiouridine synthesizing protein A
MAPAETLDCRGLKCPLPVLKTEKRLSELSTGTTLVVLATDPIAKIDIPLYCIQQGHTCETAEEAGDFTFTIIKKS